MNASAGEVEAAKLLSNVMDARRRLEEDAIVEAVGEGGGGGGVGGGGEEGGGASESAAADALGLETRLQEAMDAAEVRTS